MENKIKVARISLLVTISILPMAVSRKHFELITDRVVLEYYFQS